MLSSMDECFQRIHAHPHFEVFGAEGPASLLQFSDPFNEPDKPLTVGGECKERNVSASVR
jgi:hypothetical protein